MLRDGMKEGFSYALSMKTIMKEYPGTQATRKARCSIPQKIFFITSVFANRKKIFSHHENARLVAKALHGKQHWPDAKCLAWIVMPDHIHVLLELGDKEPLSLVMQRIKSLTSHAINIEAIGGNRFGNAVILIMPFAMMKTCIQPHDI